MASLSSSDQITNGVRQQRDTTLGAEECVVEREEEGQDDGEEFLMEPYRWLDRAILDSDASQSTSELVASIQKSREALDEMVEANPDVIIVRCAYSLPIFEGRSWQNDECMTRADYELLKLRDWEYAFPPSAFGKYSDVFAWLDDIVYNVIDDTRTALFMIITGRIKCHPFLYEQHVKFEQARVAQEEESTAAAAAAGALAEAKQEDNIEDAHPSDNPDEEAPADRDLSTDDLKYTL